MVAATSSNRLYSSLSPAESSGGSPLEKNQRPERLRACSDFAFNGFDGECFESGEHIALSRKVRLVLLPHKDPTTTSSSMFSNNPVVCDHRIGHSSKKSL